MQENACAVKIIDLPEGRYRNMFPMNYVVMQKIVDSCKGADRSWHVFSRSMDHPYNQCTLKDVSHRRRPMSPEQISDIIRHKAPDCPYTFDNLMAANGYVLEDPLEDACDAMQPIPTEKKDLREKKWHVHDTDYDDNGSLVVEPEFDPDDKDDFIRDYAVFLADLDEESTVEPSILLGTVDLVFEDKMLVYMLHRYAFLKNEEEPLYAMRVSRKMIETGEYNPAKDAPLSHSYRTTILYLIYTIIKDNHQG